MIVYIFNVIFFCRCIYIFQFIHNILLMVKWMSMLYVVPGGIYSQDLLESNIIRLHHGFLHQSISSHSTWSDEADNVKTYTTI